MRKVRIIVPLLVALTTLCAGNAYADLMGISVTSQYYAYGGPYDGYGSPTSFVVDGTVQQTFCSSCDAEWYNLTITADQIDYDLFGDAGYWSPSDTSLDSDGLFIANGNLLTFSGVIITDVALDGSTNVPGFTAANVTFNANNVAIDWAALSGIDPGDKVVLDVTSSAVPEPESLLLLLIFLLLLTAAGLGVFLSRNRTAMKKR